MANILSRLKRLPNTLFASRSQFAGEPADLAVQARDRIFVVMFGIATLFAIIEFRLIYLAVNGDEGRVVRRSVDPALTAARPRILDRNGQIMALDIEVQSLFAEPKIIERPDEIYESLITALWMA